LRKASESVVVYTDGHAEVPMENPMQRYLYRTLKPDFSDITEAVVDLGSEYNQVLELK